MVVHQHIERKNDSTHSCRPEVFLQEEKDYEGDEDYIRLVTSLSINLWLIIATFILSRMLSSETEDWTLMKNNRRFLVVIWGFITAYIGWVVYDFCVYLKGYKDFFQMTMLWLLIPFVCNYIPISLVLYLHFRNVHSLGQVIQKWIKNIQESKNSQEESLQQEILNASYNQVTVHLPVLPQS